MEWIKGLTPEVEDRGLHLTQHWPRFPWADSEERCAGHQGGSTGWAARSCEWVSERRPRHHFVATRLLSIFCRLIQLTCPYLPVPDIVSYSKYNCTGLALITIVCTAGYLNSILLSVRKRWIFLFFFSLFFQRELLASCCPYDTMKEVLSPNAS